MAEIALPRALRETLDWLKWRACVWFSTRDVSEGLLITRAAAYGRLTRLADLGLISKHAPWRTRWEPRLGRYVTLRAVYWHYVPIPPPVPKPIIAVVDSTTGFLIQYLESEFEGARVWLYNEEEEEFVEAVEQVRIEYTLSIKTPGHEDLIAELTCYTIIKAEDMDEKHAIKDITDQLKRKAESWLLDKFTLYTKEGIPVVPRFKITPDFDIQRRAKPEEAKIEGFIKQWFMEVTGEWVQKPRIIKAGIGYYTTTEKATWRTAFVYVEYAHAEEPMPTHRLPPVAEERIDP